MRIVVTRKGCDGAAGAAPSPIVDDRPVSLPVSLPTALPGWGPADCRFDDLALGAVVEHQITGKLTGTDACHAETAFEDGRCALGQTGAACGDLVEQGVGVVGDVFLFFGLFAEERPSRRHHRLFGYLAV